MARSVRFRKPRYMLSLQGRSESRVAGNEPQLTVNLLTGRDDHFVYAGTFTVTEEEYDDLVHALRQGLRGRVEVAIGPLEHGPLVGGRTQRRRNSGKAA